MSLIFPKKEILYAPMLGTLGGGSARGFGQRGGGGAPFGEARFTNTIALSGSDSSVHEQTYTWTVPDGVKSISVLCIGSGGSGAGYTGRGAAAGGALVYGNNIAVSSGQTYSLQVGYNKFQQSGPSFTWFNSSSFLQAESGLAGGNASYRGGLPSGTAMSGGGEGGDSGQGGTDSSGGDGGGGGGAGGYSGKGGRGGDFNSNNSTNGNGGGGSGGEGYLSGGGGFALGYPGGGVGIFGEGASGVGTTNKYGNPGSGGVGKVYGGGGGGYYTNTNRAEPGEGIIRIVWPGDVRLFPTTEVGDISEEIYINNVLQP
jgi:hypothetical protein